MHKASFGFKAFILRRNPNAISAIIATDLKADITVGLQAFRVCVGPVIRCRYFDPGRNVVLCEIGMPMAGWSIERQSHVQSKLELSDNRDEDEMLRNIFSGRIFHPRRCTPQGKRIVKHDRVAGILQKGDAHGAPWGLGLGANQI